MEQVLNNIDFKTLERVALVSVVALGAYGAYRVYQGADSFSQAIGEPLGGFLAKVQQLVNGNHAIVATEAGIPLTDLGLTNPEPGLFYMKPGKRRALELLHTDNKTILDAILTPLDQVKPAYIGFINVKAVTLGDI